MLLGIEIAMAVIGLAALVRGRMPLTERAVVEGAKARLFGVVALQPGLFTLGAWVFVGGSSPRDELKWLWMAQLGAILICAALIYGLGLCWARRD